MPFSSTMIFLPSDESASAMVVPAAAGADAAGAEAAADGAAVAAAADGAVLAPLLEHAARMALSPMASATSRCFCIPVLLLDRWSSHTLYARSGATGFRGAASDLEHEPAQLVAEPLVVEHELADPVGQATTLPRALPTSDGFALGLGRCGLRRPDRVRRGPELVGRHMAHRGGLGGGIRRVPCRPAQVARGGVRVAGGRARLAPRDLATGPRASEVDRPARTVVVRPLRLEEGQHVLRAVGRPQRGPTMVVVLERPAAAHGDEPRIADLGEDHRFARLPRPSVEGHPLVPVRDVR